MARQDSKETTPDLFEEFGIAQDAEDVAITSDKIAEAFLEAFGMDGGEPEPNDPNFWEKHDKKHHHGHFDPETQRCSLRNEVESAEGEKDAGDDIGTSQPHVKGLEAPSQRGAEQHNPLAWVEELIQKAPGGNSGYTARERRISLESWKSKNRAYIPLGRHSTLEEAFGKDPRWLSIIRNLRSQEYNPKDHTGGNSVRWRKREGFDGFSSIVIAGDTVGLAMRNGFTRTGFGDDGVEADILLANLLRHNGIQAEYSEVHAPTYGTLTNIDAEGRFRPLEGKYSPVIPPPKYSESEISSIVKSNTGFSTSDEAKDFLHSVFRLRTSKAVNEVVLDSLVPLNKETEDAVFETYAPLIVEQIRKYPVLQGILAKSAFIPGIEGTESSKASVTNYKESPTGPEKTMLHCRLKVPYQRESDDEIPNNVEDLAPQEKGEYDKNQQEKRRAVLMHEIGHIIYHQNNARNEWLSLIDKAAIKERKADHAWYKKISHYAGKNYEEAHSEAFALFTLPNYKKGTLPSCVEEYFEKILNSGAEEVSAKGEGDIAAVPSSPPSPGILVDPQGNKIPDLFAEFGIV